MQFFQRSVSKVNVENYFKTKVIPTRWCYFACFVCADQRMNEYRTFKKSMGDLLIFLGHNILGVEELSGKYSNVNLYSVLNFILKVETIAGYMPEKLLYSLKFSRYF